MIVLLAVFIFCSYIDQVLTTTATKTKDEHFILPLKNKSLETKALDDQLSRYSSLTELEGVTNISKSYTAGDFQKPVQVRESKSNTTTTVETKEFAQSATGKAIEEFIIKAAKSDRSKYNFKPSRIGDSWLIGAENDNYANAYRNGLSGCPYNLTIPSSLTDENGQTKIVEVIGQYAFASCAYRHKTRILILTKQVKVIKRYGFGFMDKLEEFIIQEGSVLETIETHGLEYVGSKTGKTLILPSTLSSVFRDGIYCCSLFSVIIYCGSNPLSNSSTLVHPSSGNKVVVKVSSQYPSDQNIFGQTPDRNSQVDVEEGCSNMDLQTTSSHTRSPHPVQAFLQLSLHSSLTLFLSMSPLPLCNCPPLSHPLFQIFYSRHFTQACLNLSPKLRSVSLM